MPAEFVSRLCANATCSEMDALWSAETALAQAFDEAERTLEERIGAADDTQRRPLVAALRKIRKGKVPQASKLYDFAVLERARQEVATRQQIVEEAYRADEATISASLRELAQCDELREALVWQNLAALRTGLTRILDAKGEGTKKHRRSEQMLGSYLQRYCVKNDTIGFFGPQGSGLLEPGNAWRGQNGQSKLSKRLVFLEHWAVSELADAISTEPELRPHLAPRLPASRRVESGRLWHGYGDSSSITPDVEALLLRCDGTQSAADIAQALCSDGALDFDDADDVFDLLEELDEQNIIAWKISIPTAPLRAEEWLAQFLRDLPDDVGGRGLEALGRLSRAADAVASAAGQSEHLARALDDLNTTFSELTGREATRAEGQMYAGRTLVYEECLRDFELHVGIDALRGAANALEMLLQSARWFTAEVARRFEARWREVFDSLCSESGGERIDYLRFFGVIRHDFGTGAKPSSIVEEVREELQSRWQKLLFSPSARAHVQVDSETLRDDVARVFAAESPGWPSARYHSPDLMVAEMPRGRDPGLFVLGELHAAVNTCGVRVFQSVIDHADELARARDLDLPGVAVVPVVPRAEATRADHVWMSSQCFDLETGDTPSWRDPSQVLKIGALDVTSKNGRLVVTEKGGGREFPLTAFLDTALSAEVSGDFNILPSMRHRPRITVDSLVVGRESWRFSPEEMEFARVPRGCHQFTEARRWAREQGLPRMVFAKIPEETKPIFVDFASPLLVEIFARQCRQASRISVSEMLPKTDELWLADASGARFTSELRIVAVDPRAWSE